MTHVNYGLCPVGRTVRASRPAGGGGCLAPHPAGQCLSTPGCLSTPFRLSVHAFSAFSLTAGGQGHSELLSACLPQPLPPVLVHPQIRNKERERASGDPRKRLSSRQGTPAVAQEVISASTRSLRPSSCQFWLLIHALNWPSWLDN